MQKITRQEILSVPTFEKGMQQIYIKKEIKRELHQQYHAYCAKEGTTSLMKFVNLILAEKLGMLLD